MIVEMKHNLTRTRSVVDLDTKIAPLLSKHSAHLKDRFGKLCVDIRWRGQEVGIVFFWADQQVNRRLRRNIAEDDCAFVFKENLRRRLSGDDSAENAFHKLKLRLYGSFVQHKSTYLNIGKLMNDIGFQEIGEKPDEFW